MVRRSWRPNITAKYWPPLLWPSALCLSRSPGLLNRRPLWLSSLLDDGFLYCILSATSLDPNSSGGPEGLCGLMWLSLPHLVYNSFSNCLTSVLTELYNNSTLNNRLLDLWNSMFDRHQAEITVMQFRGHSLPVHQSMSVPWDFFLPCLISSAKSRLRDIFGLLTIGMCHFVSVHHFGMAYFGRVEGQNTTDRYLLYLERNLRTLDWWSYHYHFPLYIRITQVIV